MMKWLIVLWCGALMASAPVLDVVIPCASTDAWRLEWCVKGVKENIQNVRRVIVVSAERLTDNAEWFAESKYPFSIRDIGKEIFPDSPSDQQWFELGCTRRGWIFQQLLKLYAPFVIPDIAPNVLIVDADVVFLHPYSPFTAKGNPRYALGMEYHAPYFQHMRRLLPQLTRCHPYYSGIANQMLFQRSVLIDLFTDIEQEHKKEAWRAICSCIDPAETEGSALSEYEIYFNYIIPKQKYGAQAAAIRWKNEADFSDEALRLDARSGFIYVTYHDPSRGCGPKRVTSEENE